MVWTYNQTKENQIVGENVANSTYITHLLISEWGYIILAKHALQSCKKEEKTFLCDSYERLFAPGTQQIGDRRDRLKRLVCLI